MADPFFDEPEEQSRVKAEIVVKYFVAWSKIILKNSERIGYFDFFAGPGRYNVSIRFKLPRSIDLKFPTRH